MLSNEDEDADYKPQRHCPLDARQHTWQIGVGALLTII